MPDQDKPQDLPEDLKEEYAEINKKAEGALLDKLGATKQHPEVISTQEDQSEIKFKVGHTKDKVIVHFGKRVEWLSMDPDQAIEFGRTLIRTAKRTNSIIII